MTDALTRSAPFSVTRAETTGDGLTLEGYAAVFGTPTRIDSWEGTFDEVIERGAFAKTIAENTPVLQFDHGQHPLLGSIPLGSITVLREDDNGLFVRARISDNWLTQPIRDAIADGAITGMSFRFSVVRDEWDTSGDVDVRTLREVRLYELGPVVFPAYPDTVVGVRSKDIETLLSDTEIRDALAKVLTFGHETSPADSDAARSGTSDDAPAEPPKRTPLVTKSDIAKAIRDIDLNALSKEN